jgi:AcrR family transcriptional regulator
MPAMAPKDAKPARRGRRPGASGTRDAIIAAAQEQFATNGFDAVSMRAIARAADVDPALVLHFFRTKNELFAAAARWPFDAETAVAQIVPGPRAQLGRRLATFFASIWEQPEGRGPIMAMLRAATTSPEAAALLRTALTEHVLGPVGRRLEGLSDDERALRLSLCSSQLIGLGVARYIVALEPLASMRREALIDLVAPTLQRYLTGKLDLPGGR